MQQSAPLREAVYFIHGRGRGHASRSQAVLQALSATGCRAQVFAGGDAGRFLDEQGTAYDVRSPLLPGPGSIARLVLRTGGDLRRLRRQNPDLLVSDGDQSALLAARVLQIPSVAIGHDLIFSGDVGLPPLPGRALAVQRLNALPTRTATRRVAVHFLPAVSYRPSLVIARPNDITRQNELTSACAADGRMLCYFRDRNGLPLVRALRARGQAVVWFTNEEVNEPGVDVRPASMEGFRAALRECSAVVASAGSNLLAECVMLRKPIFALYRSTDTEQRLNAILAERAGIAVGSNFDDAIASCDRFLQQVKAGDFATVDLCAALPPLSEALAGAIRSL